MNVKLFYFFIQCVILDKIKYLLLEEIYIETEPEEKR